MNVYGCGWVRSLPLIQGDILKSATLEIREQIKADFQAAVKSLGVEKSIQSVIGSIRRINRSSCSCRLPALCTKLPRFHKTSQIEKLLWQKIIFFTKKKKKSKKIIKAIRHHVKFMMMHGCGARFRSVAKVEFQ